jgi:hypothetical protein
MPTYQYNGPRAGVTHPTTGTRLVLIDGQTYDLPKDSLPSLMSANRPADVGRLTLTEQPVSVRPKIEKPKTPATEKPSRTGSKSDSGAIAVVEKS